MPRIADGLWTQFQKGLRSAAAARNYRLDVSGTQERLAVDLDGQTYLVLIPGSRQPLTPGNVAKRVASWPRIKKRVPGGYVILSSLADLSPTLAARGRLELSNRVAVVGSWGRRNNLAASTIDDGMALILEAAGVPPDRIAQAERLSARLAEDGPSTTAQPAVPPPSGARTLRPGDTLDAYNLERRLGRGHSAEVWKASVTKTVPGVDLRVGQTVALKVYSMNLLHGFQTLRIQREFSIAAELVHPNLARVYDLVLSPSRPFHAFLAMEYVEGPTAKALIERRGPMSVDRVISMGLQLFSALEEVHSHGALHRDVKAANILVAGDRRDDLTIKLVDLGIVSIPEEDRLTQASVFLGSKHSAPLEQLTGDDLDERTDIYGAGSVLYHALTGSPLYDAVGPEGAIVRQMLTGPETLAVRRDGNPRGQALAEFVNRCIEVEPEDRPSSARHCIRILQGLSGA